MCLTSRASEIFGGVSFFPSQTAIKRTLSMPRVRCGIQRPAVIAFVDVVAFLGQADLVGLVEFIHEWMIAHRVEPLNPLFAARADEVAHVGCLYGWEIRAGRVCRVPRSIRRI